MSFMDELRKLTQPYEDEDDFYEGADPSAQPPAPTEAQLEFENAFGGRDTPEPAEEETEDSAPATQDGGGKGIFSGLGRKKAPRPRIAARERTVEFGGTEQQVILFNPKSFDEAASEPGAEHRDDAGGGPDRPGQTSSGFPLGNCLCAAGEDHPDFSEDLFCNPAEC